MGHQRCRDRRRPGRAAGHPLQHLPAQFDVHRRRPRPEHRAEGVHRREVRRRHLLGHRGVLPAVLPRHERTGGEQEPAPLPPPPTRPGDRERRQVRLHRWRRAVSDGDDQRRGVPQRVGDHVRGDPPQRRDRLRHLQLPALHRRRRLSARGWPRGADRHLPVLGAAGVVLRAEAGVGDARRDRSQRVREQRRQQLVHEPHGAVDVALHGPRRSTLHAPSTATGSLP